MITLTDKQFDEIINTVTSEMLDIFNIRVTTDTQDQNVTNLAVHANNLAHGYNEQGSKVR